MPDLLECEARFWRRYCADHGRAAWNAAKAGIEKRRGKEGLQVLVDEMNRQLNESKKKRRESK